MSRVVPARVQTILVIDDNSQNRLVAEGHLAAAGYNVVLAEDGLAGVQAFQERCPDLVLLDILMPGIDGYETCRQLKALPRGLDTPVVFLTALLDLGSHQKALESGADDFLTKPINRTELLIRVRSLLWIRRLRDELSEGYQLIRSQRDALIHAQRQKEELSALVVHDLKGPLTAILALVNLALEDPSVIGETRDSLDDVATAANSMHRMVLNLLDISRSEDGRLVPQLQQLELAEVVSVVEAVFRRTAEAKGQTIVSEFHDRGLVQADRDLAQRVIENLLENSIKYAPANSVIQLEVQSTNGVTELRVRDQGSGIAEEHRQRIFEKYFQIEPSLAANARASRGLGLAFCRLAVEAHGGRIWLEQNQPRGSVFCVRFPHAVGEPGAPS